MRRILMVLLLAACGCSDGGAGIAGFGAPPLTPGIYTGQQSCTLSATDQPTVNNLNIESLIISENGIPLIEGDEAREGGRYSFVVGGVLWEGFITDVILAPNGVEVRADATAATLDGSLFFFGSDVRTYTQESRSVITRHMIINLSGILSDGSAVGLEMNCFSELEL